MKKSKSKEDKGSTERFGYEWDKYNEIIPQYEDQFLRWVQPLSKKDFKGKTILDAGCGIGRNSLWPLSYGARKVVSFDFDKRTVKRAKENLSKFKNSEVFYQSIYNIDYKNKFDLSFSIGVIHHLEKPKEAVKNLVNATKKNGKILLWVYGYEGNEWIVKYINPLRRITSKLPPFLTRAAGTLITIPLYLNLKIFNQTHSYMKQISKFNFRHIECIVLDQLIPKIANYWTKEETINLFNNLPVKNIEINQTNNNSWTIIATKK